MPVSKKAKRRDPNTVQERMKELDDWEATLDGVDATVYHSTNISYDFMALSDAKVSLGYMDQQFRRWEPKFQKITTDYSAGRFTGKNTRPAAELVTKWPTVKERMINASNAVQALWLLSNPGSSMLGSHATPAGPSQSTQGYTYSDGYVHPTQGYTYNEGYHAGSSTQGQAISHEQGNPQNTQASLGGGFSVNDLINRPG